MEDKKLKIDDLGHVRAIRLSDSTSVDDAGFVKLTGDPIISDMVWTSDAIGSTSDRMILYSNYSHILYNSDTDLKELIEKLDREILNIVPEMRGLTTQLTNREINLDVYLSELESLILKRSTMTLSIALLKEKITAEEK